MRKDSDIEISAKIWAGIKGEAKPGRMTKVKANDTSVTYEELLEKSDRIPMVFCQISDNLPEDLSAATMKLIFKIAKELKYGNYLWYFDHKNMRNLKSALQELRANAILFKTSDPKIHIVNPLFITKGNPITVAGHSMNCIIKNFKVCIEAITPFRNVKIELDTVAISKAWFQKLRGK